MQIDIQLHKILDKTQCYEILRSLRWEEGVSCVVCGSKEVVKNGKDDAEVACQRYLCKTGGHRFDDLSETIFSGSHYPLTTWISALYLMHLNVSNTQIASELDISESNAFALCSQIREGVEKKSLLYSLAKKLKLTNVIS